MKITKEKLPGDKQGYYMELDKGEKFEEMIAIKYKEMKKVINSHKVKIKNFIISSGKVVLTSIGESNFCANVMWSFPKGNYDAYIHSDIKEDSIFIPFIKFNSVTVRYHLFLNTVHLPKGEIIPSYLIEANCLPVNGGPLFLMDEAEWLENKSILYSKNNATYEDIAKKLSNSNTGKATMIPFETSDNAKLKGEDGIKVFYFAYSGFTLDGDPAYLWLRKIKQDDNK